MKHQAQTATALAVALLVSACASTGTSATRIETPTSKATRSTTARGVVAGTQDLSRWWERLGDDTLSGLVDQALAGRPDIRTTQARLRLVGISPGFDASWEPDIFGGTRTAIEAAR